MFKKIKKSITGAFQWFGKQKLWQKIVIVILILGCGWFGFKRLSGNKTQQPTYQTAQVERGTLVTSVTASGTVTAGSSATISSSATGVVSNIYVKNGDMVTKGQKIATITLDTDSLQKQTAAWASYLSAQNNLNAAKSKMNSLQANLFTANQTFVNGAGTINPITDDPKYIIQRANWLQAESDYNNQQGVINQAQASLASSWLSYSQLSSTITAPVSGTISNLTIAPGTLIAANTSSNSNSNASTSQSFGTVTLTGGKPQATINLTEIDIVNIKIGQKATLTLDAFPDKTFTGKVSAINTNGSVSSGVTTYPTTITFDTAVDNMYPNMAVSATIITDVKDNVLLVPSTAVQTTNGQSTVTVLRNNQPQPVTVTIGTSSDTQTEITSGVSEGDTIVTSTITATTGSSTTGQTTSPFSPFGGNRGFGGGGNNRGGGTGGRNAIRIGG